MKPFFSYSKNIEFMERTENSPCTRTDFIFNLTKTYVMMIDLIKGTPLLCPKFLIQPLNVVSASQVR